MKISKRVEALPLSPTLAMAKKSREMKKRGLDVINLGMGEPDFSTPGYIKDAAFEAIKENYTYYPPVAGYMALRQAIADKLKRENNLSYNHDKIVVSCGGKHSIFNIIISTINPGDEVIIPCPYWVSYPAISTLAGGKNVFIPTDVTNRFKITPKQLKDAITPKTKLFIFSSPSNPTGSIYSYDELKSLAAVFVQNPHVLVVSDEIYEYINFVGEHQSIAQFDEIKENVVLVNGVSKGFAMTGWRLGYMAAPRWLAIAAIKLQGQTTSGVNTITQRATIEALNGRKQHLEKMINSYKKRRDLSMSILKEIKGFKLFEPPGAFYLFPDISAYFGAKYKNYHINNSKDFSNYILQDALVSIVMGSAFGDENCIRISYATSREALEKGLLRIKEAVSRLE